MSNHPTSCSSEQSTYPPHHFWISVLRATVISLVIGVLLDFLFQFGGSPIVNLVISVIIGWTIMFFILGLRRLIWRNRRPDKWGFILICVIATLTGYYIGLAIALTLFGIPFSGLYGVLFHNDVKVPVLSIIFGLISATFFWNQNKISELIAQSEKEKALKASIEKQALQAQLQMLRAQIEPHMLFNTLANLQALISIDTAKAQHMLEQLIVYLRATLDQSRVQSTTLQKEFELIQAYLDILKIRMGERLHYELDLPADLESTSIAPMLIQPLVENAIKHGLEPKLEGGSIKVCAEIQQHEHPSILHIRIIDNGFGLTAEQDILNDNRQVNAHDRQLGNANIKERLQVLYGEHASLNLSPNLPEGVIAHLYLPLHQLTHEGVTA